MPFSTSQPHSLLECPVPMVIAPAPSQQVSEVGCWGGACLLDEHVTSEFCPGTAAQVSHRILSSALAQPWHPITRSRERPSCFRRSASLPVSEGVGHRPQHTCGSGDQGQLADPQVRNQG